MKYTVAETFVGAGGSHLGFKWNGFISKYVNDFNSDAMETLLVNNPEIKDTAWVDVSSIVDRKPTDILKKTKMKKGELDVLFGGIVCKGFSLAGERSPNDERNYFYRKQLELVKGLKPKISIIENVPGIQNAKVLSSRTPKELADRVDTIWQSLEDYKGQKANLRKQNKITKKFEEKGIILRKQKDSILKELTEKGFLKNVMEDIFDKYESLGYVVEKRVINSACFGAATRRERVIIVAVRKDINVDFIFPQATHGDEEFKKKYEYLYKGKKKICPLSTVNDALKKIDYSNKDDLDNKPMNHSEKTVERFKYIPEGDNIANHMDELPEELRISRFYSRGNTMRLDGNKPSPTLVPGHSNFPVHPTQHRSITVREAACITGFPDKYKFIGSHTKRCEEVGNAVPPALSNAIAKQAKKLLDKYYSKKKIKEKKHEKNNTKS